MAADRIDDDSGRLPPAADSPPRPAHAGVPPALPRVSSRELLGNGRELLIEHRGAWYRLRETALGKLILTK